MDSLNQRISIPIQHSTNNSRDTTAQWISDPNNGNEKYRMRINIEGFNQNEVNARVDGNRLFIYGERIENKSQGTSKKIIEKSYNLPPDIDTFRPYITFPSLVTMQVEFPSKHGPSKLNTTNNQLTRRIPIINSRNSTYKFDSNQPKPHRSGSPALSHITEEDTIRSTTPESDTSTESSIFPSDFNSKAFYESIFEPEIFIDDRHHRYIELKLDVPEYNPDDIQVSINDNDLIVQVENTSFYKQITLPSNVDAASLSIHHHHNKKLYITIKLLDEYSSIKYI